MGSGASIPTNFDLLTAENVGDLVASLGNAYLGYRELFASNGISGDIISSLKTPEDIKATLQDIGIVNALHQRVIMSKLGRAEGFTSAAQAVVAPAGVPGQPTKDISSILTSDRVTLTPREIMSQLFQIQGIATDPSDLDTVITKLSKVMTKGYGDGENTYDCFINYRVATDADLAEKLFLYLNLAGYHPFLDKKCLKNGENWKDGFLKGFSAD
jgi:hypothetical protein